MLRKLAVKLDKSLILVQNLLRIKKTSSKVLLVERGFTQVYRFSDGPFNLRFDCDDSWRSVFLFLEGPAITLKLAILG